MAKFTKDQETLEVQCDNCGAKPTESCKSVIDGHPVKFFHVKRILLSRKK